MELVYELFGIASAWGGIIAVSSVLLFAGTKVLDLLGVDYRDK